MLFEDGVLTPVLIYMPENDVERCNQGLSYFNKEQPEAFARMRTLRGTNIDFRGVLRAVSSEFSSLVGSCVDISGRLARRGDGKTAGSAGGARLWQILCQTKNNKLAELMQPAGQHQDRKSVV